MPPGRLSCLLGVVCALVLIVAACSGAGEPVPTRTPGAPGHQPNIILIVTDDQDQASLTAMPGVQSLLVQQGTTLQNFFVTTPLDSPARASILRGQYAHNHGVRVNQPPNGGFGLFHLVGEEASTVASSLQAAGYRTALFGQYMNGYPPALPPEEGPKYVPPGWDQWFATSGPGAYTGFDYLANENGTLLTYGSDPQDFESDVISQKASEFVRGASAGQPFFLYVAPYAAHAPAAAAPRDEQLFESASAPRPPSFNEADVSDKPAYIRDAPLLTDERQAQIDADYRQRLRSLQSIDRMVADLVGALQDTGALADTYIFFTSDGGYMQGEHRVPANNGVPYEQSVRVGLIVRGPGVPAGRTIDQLAGNIDLLPTFTDIANLHPPGFVDGRSLLPLLGTKTPKTWRKALLIEHWGGTAEFPSLQTYDAVRTDHEIYIEYVTGEHEYYDLQSDPDELRNGVASASAEYLGRLAGFLHSLTTCAGAVCPQVEDAGP